MSPIRCSWSSPHTIWRSNPIPSLLQHHVATSIWDGVFYPLTSPNSSSFGVTSFPRTNTGLTWVLASGAAGADWHFSSWSESSSWVATVLALAWVKMADQLKSRSSIGNKTMFNPNGACQPCSLSYKFSAQNNFSGLINILMNIFDQKIEFHSFFNIINTCDSLELFLVRTTFQGIRKIRMDEDREQSVRSWQWWVWKWRLRQRRIFVPENDYWLGG